MDQAVETAVKIAERPQRRLVGWLVGLVVILAAGIGVAGVLYVNANERVAKLEAEKKALMLENKKNEDKAKPDIANPDTPEEQGEYIRVKRWGVKIKLPYGQENLGYEVHNVGDKGTVYFLAVGPELEKESPVCYKEYQKVVKEKGVAAAPGVAIGAYTKVDWEKSGFLEKRNPVFENEKYKFSVSAGHYSLCRDANGQEVEGKARAFLFDWLKKSVSNL